MAQGPGLLLVAAGRLRADHHRRHLAARPDLDDRHARRLRGRARRGGRPRSRLVGAPRGAADRWGHPRPARARRDRRGDLLPDLRWRERQLGGHLGEDEPGGRQDRDLARGRRRRRRTDGHGRCQGGRARDPQDAAERRREGDRRTLGDPVLPRARDAQHALRAQGRSGLARLHQPPSRGPGTHRRRRDEQCRQVAAQLLPGRHDHRRVQRRPHRARGADHRRPARRDDRGRHLRRCLHPLPRRMGGRRVRGVHRARCRGNGRGDHHGGRRTAGKQRAPAADPAVRDGSDARHPPARGPDRHDQRRRPVRHGRADPRRPTHLGGRPHHRPAAGAAQRRVGAARMRCPSHRADDVARSCASRSLRSPPSAGPQAPVPTG